MGPRAPAKDTDRYFEEIPEGERYWVEEARTITQADIQNFAGVSGDFHRNHVSEQFARSTTVFEGRVAHGTLVFAITEATVTDRNPKEFSYGHDNLRFVAPVYPGDTLSFERQVTEKAPYDDEHGRVVYHYQATNEQGDVVLADDHIKLVERRAQPSDPE